VVDSSFWPVVGGIATAFLGYRFMKHAVYVVWRVWAVLRMFDKPLTQPLTSGPATVVGIVQASGAAPVRVKIEERGKYSGGNIQWEEASRRVRARPFTLFLPQQQISILVEPNNNVMFRAIAFASHWKSSKKNDDLRRLRIAELRDGDRAVVTGHLAIVEVAEPLAGGYRSKNIALRTEYNLRPPHPHAMKIDAEHFVDEVRVHFGNIGWIRGIGFAAASASYINAVQQAFSTSSVTLLSTTFIAYLVVRLLLLEKNRVPWFERSKSLLQPPRGTEPAQHSHSDIF